MISWLISASIWIFTVFAFYKKRWLYIPRIIYSLWVFVIVFWFTVLCFSQRTVLVVAMRYLIESAIYLALNWGSAWGIAWGIHYFKNKKKSENVE